MTNQRLLITGSNGFLGKMLARHLLKNEQLDVYTTSRHEDGFPNHLCRDLERDNLNDICYGIDTVIHLAARAHKQKNDNDSILHFQANIEATLKLLNSAIQHKIKRFIFISTIGVYGNETFGQVLTENSPVAPHSPYAESKLRAEEKLRIHCEKIGIELLILRLPLVAHMDAPANFGRLVSLVKKGCYLPFLRMNNRRSLLSLNNFISFMDKVLAVDKLPSTTYLLADKKPYSTEEIIKAITSALAQKERLIYLSPTIMKLGLSLAGKKQMYQQLWGSLEADPGKAMRDFDWKPDMDLAKNIVFNVR